MNETGATTNSEFSSIVHYATGSIYTKTDSVPSYSNLSGDIANGYDSLNQLTSSQSTRPDMTYTQDFGADSAGNLTNLRSNTVAYTNRNEIDETGFVFDSNGNPTTYNGTSATWNDENKMTAFGSALTAAYRPDGMRAYKSNGTTTTYFIYDQNGVPVQEIVGGSVSAVNTFGPNGLISRNASSDVFYQFDERGDTVDRTNSSGTVLDYHGSDPYGQQYSSAAVSDPNQGFGAQWGYYFDGETGFSLLGQRYYDPAAGRFLNQDPIGFEGGINVYGYGLNNPAGFADPSGLNPIKTLAVILGDRGAALWWSQARIINPEIEAIVREYASEGFETEVKYYDGPLESQAKVAVEAADSLIYLGHAQAGILSLNHDNRSFFAGDLEDIFHIRKEQRLDFVYINACEGLSAASGEDWSQAGKVVYGYFGDAGYAQMMSGDGETTILNAGKANYPKRMGAYFPGARRSRVGAT